MKNFCSPNDENIICESDSKSIQKAIDDADKYNIGKVVIPKYNERTKNNIWNIDETILIPSNMIIILDDCHLRLCDNTFCNVFRNKSFFTEKGNTLEGEDKNIYLLGKGNAIIDGGNYNGLSERNSLK